MGTICDEAYDNPGGETVIQTEVKIEPANTRKPGKVLKVDHEYVSSNLDGQISDLDTYELVRKQEVEETLAYFDSVRQPLTHQLTEAILVMEGKKEDPYRSLRLPDHIGAASLTDLTDVVSRLANAYMTYAEYLSAVRAIGTMREGLYERRVRRAAINEGTNETERKALSAMRAEPEFLAKTKVEMLQKWVETRYFAFKGMLEAAQQVLTTKSVEASRDRIRDTE